MGGGHVCATRLMLAPPCSVKKGYILPKVQTHCVHHPPTPVLSPVNRVWEAAAAQPPLQQAASLVRLMPLLENSPVGCAYGLWRTNGLALQAEAAVAANAREIHSTDANSSHADAGANGLAAAKQDATQADGASQHGGGADTGFFWQGLPAFAPSGADPSQLCLEPVEPLEGPPATEDLPPVIDVLVNTATTAIRAAMSLQRRAAAVAVGPGPAQGPAEEAAEEAASMQSPPPCMLRGWRGCGYQARALEWDLWLHPSTPWRLGRWTVDHGSASALVTQARVGVLGIPDDNPAALVCLTAPQASVPLTSPNLL